MNMTVVVVTDDTAQQTTLG